MSLIEDSEIERVLVVTAPFREENRADEREAVAVEAGTSKADYSIAGGNAASE